MKPFRIFLCLCILLLQGFVAISADVSSGVGNVTSAGQSSDLVAGFSGADENRFAVVLPFLENNYADFGFDADDLDDEDGDNFVAQDRCQAEEFGAINSYTSYVSLLCHASNSFTSNDRVVGQGRARHILLRVFRI